MFPLRDTTPCRSYPYVNNALLAINIVVYLYQLGMGDSLPRFFYQYGLVPARYFVPALAQYFSAGEQALSLVSFMFLHGGFMHLLGNMWMLYIFGDNIEDRLGPLRYVLFYLLCGLASGISHMVLNAGSNVPVVGASGAIAGVMGAYFILYPAARILTLVPILIIPYFIEIPAFVFLGIWFVMQFLNASFGAGAAGGVAWWAHIGGFIFGILFLKMFQTLPESGLTRKIKKATARKKSDRLQVIRPAGPAPDADTCGVLRISPFEALTGTRKLVNIPSGLRKRLIRVSVPPGITSGTVLRLRGMGRQLADGRRGNLLLKVVVES